MQETFEPPPPPPIPPKPYPGIAQTFGLVALALLGSLIAEGITRAAGLGGSAWSQVLTHGLASALVLSWGVHRSRAGLALFPLGSNRLGDLALMLLSTACLLVATLGLAQLLLSWIPLPTFLEELMQEVGELFMTWVREETFAAVVGVVILGPIAEELVFRGLLWNGYAGRYGVRRAWILTSVIFSLVHVIPSQVVAALCLGLFAGWLRIRTGGLLAPILMHILWNGAVVAVLFSEDIAEMDPETLAWDTATVATLALALVGFLATVRLLSRRLRPAGL